jgi:hypothetical protein
VWVVLRRGLADTLEFPHSDADFGDAAVLGASVVLIEDKASGTQLIQELITEGCHGATRYQPTGDKTMRLNAQTAVIESGYGLIQNLVKVRIRSRFAPDSPLEGDGFELLVPRHESPRFPKHPGRIVAPPV